MGRPHLDPAFAAHLAPGTVWAQRHPVTSLPSVSVPVMAYDSARQRLVLFSETGTWICGEFKQQAQAEHVPFRNWC